MSDYSSAAIEKTNTCGTVFVKFLSPNDTGLTGSHQCGIYIPKNSVRLIFDGLFERGQNQKRFATITWNDDIETISCFTYYGVKTRNEYRITRFGRDFDLLKPDHTGDLLVLCKETDDQYFAYVLSTEEEIEGYLEAFSLAPTMLNCLIKDEGVDVLTEDDVFDAYLVRFGGEFPNTTEMAVSAEEITSILNGERVEFSPDEQIVRWIDTEYKLFRKVEEVYYCWVTERPADSLEEFVRTGLEITNRRKSRAGKSLEHHLAALFDEEGLSYTEQAVTEGNKKPDFIFPSQEAYHDPAFPNEKLVFLGAKTTCKDRWRQVLNEANRIEKKYLFTLQQGVSPNQLEEMHAENLVLVVPERYHKCFPPTSFESVISLREFIDRVKATQENVQLSLL